MMTDTSPVSTSRAYWLFQFGIWGVYEVMNLVYARAWGYSSFVIDAILLFNTALMLLCTHIFHLLYRHRWYRSSIRVIALNLLWLLPLSAMLLQLTQAIIIWLTMSFLLSSLPNLQPQMLALESSAGAFIGYSLNTCIMLIVWCLIYLLYAEWRKHRQTEREFWQNEIRLRELELQFLRSQINSHFLFNALNNIRALILENTDAARQALSDLSTLLRGLMQSEHKQTVPLREELEWVQGYLALESLQFEQRLQFELDIDSTLLDASLPPMLLQTLVENAIKHGIARRREGGRIAIRACRHSNTCWQLQVENPAAELPPAHEGSGIGLKNARERLQSAFGEQASLRLDIAANVTAVAKLPL